MEEFRLNERETSNAFRELIEERDNLVQIKHILKQHIEGLEDENDELKQKVHRVQADYESQLIKFKSKVFMLENELKEFKLDSPVKKPPKLIGIKGTSNLRTYRLPDQASLDNSRDKS
eukprot:CAMPEP_0204918176 /NCGR_PEP_ID=MMETSP1397-20131031/15942_1 /ASSEMBLY_ACC=CAM_ASM_000891 /TAXON_ID=49980 /ORGANISM="Climacostomum Climacostomum virens, Strain Stock W-24" /LENGTH=117 /DNA_ID=CAMNT_0052091357 /DNA_START=175 /DNA_END=525 /DNA_ORIENTATION=-